MKSKEHLKNSKLFVTLRKVQITYKKIVKKNISFRDTVPLSEKCCEYSSKYKRPLTDYFNLVRYSILLLFFLWQPPCHIAPAQLGYLWSEKNLKKVSDCTVIVVTFLWNVDEYAFSTLSSASEGDLVLQIRGKSGSLEKTGSGSANEDLCEVGSV